jgi:hypothetical protein
VRNNLLWNILHAQLHPSLTEKAVRAQKIRWTVLAYTKSRILPYAVKLNWFFMADV